MKEITIPIKGMHCHSCEVLLTEELEALPDVKKAEVSLKTKAATIYVSHTPPRSVVHRAVQAAGYEVGYDENPLVTRDERVYKDFSIGLVVLSVLYLLYTGFDLKNVANINTSGASIGLVALVIGLTAGFSTCIAMIGGLVLGISARHAEKHPTATPMQKFRPHLFFNLGRIVSFIIFGALIGALGAAFQLKGSLLGLVTIGVGVVMLMLGIKLTEIFPRFKGSFALPSSVGKFIGIKKHGAKEYSHKDAILMGAVTFFLPCGFTQAMQLMAVSTGSPVSGAIIMGAFALGTAPGLLSIGGLTSVVKGVFAKRFFRVVGVVVIAMAFINFSNGYNLMGLSNVFAKNSNAPTSTTKQAGTGGTAPAPVVTTTESGEEVVKLATTFRFKPDITPSTFTTKVGKKTVLVVDVKEDGAGCMSTIMIPGLDNNAQLLEAGKKLTLTFTPKKAGVYQITCAMGVPRGKISVEG